jgi:hypothetical protein
MVFVVVVSEIMRYFKINKNDINDMNYWNRIIKDLHSSLIKQQDLDNKILVVKLQEITSDDNNMIPKLEYKNS